MTQDQVIAAAREAEAYATRQTSDVVDWKAIAQERFYAIAYRQGMERAAKLCDDLTAPASCSGSERSLWDVASTEIADAIRAEAHAKNQPESTHHTGNM